MHPACVLLSVCSLNFTLSRHFTPGPQSAVRSLRVTLTGYQMRLLVWRVVNRTLKFRLTFLILNSAEFNMSTLLWIIMFADQVFKDPPFFGIFVWGPLQSLVVNVCTF